jgi:hypothetical protein
LDALPDAADADLGALELRYRLDAGQAVPNLDQAFARRFNSLVEAKSLTSPPAVAASSLDANAVMALSLSMVNVVIFVISLAAVVWR